MVSQAARLQLPSSSEPPPSAILYCNEFSCCKGYGDIPTSTFLARQPSLGLRPQLLFHSNQILNCIFLFVIQFVTIVNFTACIHKPVYGLHPTLLTQNPSPSNLFGPSYHPFLFLSVSFCLSVSASYVRQDLLNNPFDCHVHIVENLTP